MTKLRIAALPDDKPVKLNIELPTTVHRDLLSYAALLSKDSSTPVDPAKLIAAMLTRFMAADRAFIQAKRAKSLP
jgi:hypothetical protein